MQRTNKNSNKDAQIIALETFSSDAFLSINKKLLSSFGPELTIYLCNLIDKFNYFNQVGKLGEDLSFFLTHENQTAQLGMSDYQLRKCKNKLKEMNILHTEMRGVPPKEFYILNIEKLVEKFLRINPKVFKGLKVKKLKDYPSKNLRNIKDNKYNNNIYKETKEKNIKKNSLLDNLPKEWIKDISFQNILQDFIQHRKEKHQPITSRAGTMLANKLSQFTMQESINALKRSIENGWTGVFPEKENNNKSKSRVTIGSGWSGQYDDPIYEGVELNE